MTKPLDIDAIVGDFRQVASLAAVSIRGDELQVEELPAPHKPPSSLPKGKMAVYVFSYRGTTLKVGKVGPRSQARYTSQHYRAGSAPSTLAASLLKHGGELGLTDIDESSVSTWIKKNTDRTNFILDATLGVAALTLLEAFLQCRLRPAFEGFESQR